MKEVKVNPEEKIQTETERSTNKNGGEKKGGAQLLLLCASYLILTLYLPIVLFFNINITALQALSILAAVVSIFAFSRLSKTPRSAVSFSLILVACFAFLGVLICGMVASFAGSVLILAYILITRKEPLLRLLAILPAIISYFAAAALLGSFTLSVAALFHIPAAIMLAYSFGKGQDRISVICKTSFGILFSIAAVLAIWFFSRYRADFSVIGPLIDAFKDNVVRIMSETLYAIYNEIDEISMTDATTLSTTAVNAVFNLLPAILVIISNVVSFLLQSMMINIFIHDETDKERIRNMTFFDMSLISAVTFLVMLVAALILSSGGKISVWSVTAENIALILMPGLVLTAILALRRFTFGKKGCSGFFVYLGIMLLIFYLPSIMLSAAAIAGAVIVILNNVTLMINNRKNKKT